MPLRKKSCEHTKDVARVLGIELEPCQHVMLFFRTWQMECNLNHLPVNVARHLKTHMMKHHFTNVFHDSSYPHVFCTFHPGADCKSLCKDFGQAIGIEAQQDLYAIAHCHRYLPEAIDVWCEECGEHKTPIAGITLYQPADVPLMLWNIQPQGGVYHKACTAPAAAAAYESGLRNAQFCNRLDLGGQPFC